METERDRAGGWQHAKLSGHKNEAIVEQMFSDKDFCQEFSRRLGIGNIKGAKVGGLCETDVECVLGGCTKSKTDLVLEMEDGSTVNISIKKSSGGQVYLIGVDRFISGFEKQFSVTVPEDIKDSLKLYFYGHEDTNKILDNRDFTSDQPEKVVGYQKRKGRLVWTSMVKYDEAKANRFLEWIKENIADIADFCFSRGLSGNKKDWADYVWYVNFIGEADFDTIFSIADIKQAVEANKHLIVPGTRGGGTTINLPFGFVQWHQKQMQFHHSLGGLTEIVDNKL